MPAIQYLVPYEIACKAADVKSGKAITNIVYLKTGLASSGPPAYGDPVPGASSTTTLLANLKTSWELYVVPYLSEHYTMSGYTMRALIGKAFKTPKVGIASLVPGTPVSVTTAARHGLVTGNSVRLSGITTPSALNTDWGVVVVDAYTYTLAGSSSATAWSGDGFSQSLIGASGWAYGSLEELASSATGGITGEALPLYASISVRRISSYSGRNFRSRLSLGPVGESDQLNGKLTTTALGLLNADLATLVAIPFANGGSDTPGSGYSFLGMVSKQVAMAQASPFTSSTNWYAYSTSMLARPNLGSMVRRKPRLTSPISS